MGKELCTISQVQWRKIAVNIGLWLAVNVGPVWDTIVNIGLWFAKTEVRKLKSFWRLNKILYE